MFWSDEIQSELIKLCKEAGQVWMRSNQKLSLSAARSDIYKPVKMLQFGIPGESGNLFPFIK